MEPSKTKASVLDNKVDIDLSVGYEDFKVFFRGASTSPNIRNPRLMALAEFEKKQQRKADADIIISQGCMLEILMGYDGLCQWVGLIDGQIFIDRLRSPGSSIQDRGSMTGCNFQALMTTEEGHKGYFEPPKDNASNYNSLILHEFPGSGTKVLVSCEVDAVTKHACDIKCSKEALPYEVPKHSVEIKCRKSNGYYLKDLFMKSIAQCYLAGAETLVIGYRSESYHLTSVEKHAVGDSLDDPKFEYNRDFLDNWFEVVMMFVKKVVAKYDLEKDAAHFVLELMRGGLIMRKVAVESGHDVFIPQFFEWRKELERAEKHSEDAEAEEDLGANNHETEAVEQQLEKLQLERGTRSVAGE